MNYISKKIEKKAFFKNFYNIKIIIKNYNIKFKIMYKNEIIKKKNYYFITKFKNKIFLYKYFLNLKKYFFSCGVLKKKNEKF